MFFVCTIDILIYSLAWGPDNEQIVYTQGKSLTIKSMQPNSRPNTVRTTYNFSRNIKKY